ncbi:MAG: CysB family HTH-type transcriptional regulator [Leptothrix ochracea]|uniref:CysB family HTH-type transcriptional regulator n=1 Tax=Leptothrix ochracea TaxID=735331 RepID=UPI0034E2359A
MNLHQFRFVQEAARHKLNLTETARVLHTSQPGISKAILELEEELGIDIFTRHGKRLTRITEPGHQVLNSIEIIMRELNNLKRIGEEFSQQEVGTLSVAATHTQARYVLPEPIAALRRQCPRVTVSLHQGTPQQVARMLLADEAEIGIATEALDQFEDLVTMPCYEWQHVAVFPSDHPLAKVERLSLEQLAAEPLVTYHPSFTGRTRIDTAFVQRGLHPQIALEAIDSDVIKTYVRMGMGVGILAEMAVRDDPAFASSFDAKGGPQPATMVAKPVGYLFGRNTARIAFKRGAYLRQFVYTLAELLSPRLTRTLLTRTMAHPDSEGTQDYGL